MISRLHRFHGHGSLKFTYQHGKTVRGPMMSLRFAPNDRRKSYRLAVVVSKKVHKSAVKRNRIRRRLYEAVRQLEENIVSPHDLIITVFTEQLAELSHDELTRMVRSQLKQASIITRK
jgi:ribonuclease P protein component